MIKKGGEIEMDFKPGDILRHKATLKRCVVKEVDSDGTIYVTTQDDETKNYRPEELELYESAKVESIDLVE